MEQNFLLGCENIFFKKETPTETPMRPNQKAYVMFVEINLKFLKISYDIDKYIRREKNSSPVISAQKLLPQGSV